MGAYVQVGVCVDVSVDEAALAGARVTREEAARALRDEFVDLSLFTELEDGGAIRWVLPEVLVEEGLIPFLRAQYAMLGRTGPKDPEVVLDRIRQAGSYDGVRALAAGRSMWEFQASTMRASLHLGTQRRLPLQASLLVYLVEGKVIMEQHRQLFDYIEALIRQQKELFPIAAAAKVFVE
jgi:hypothetical protein